MIDTFKTLIADAYFLSVKRQELIKEQQRIEDEIKRKIFLANKLDSEQLGRPCLWEEVLLSEPEPIKL